MCRAAKQRLPFILRADMEQSSWGLKARSATLRPFFSLLCVIRAFIRGKKRRKKVTASVIIMSPSLLTASTEWPNLYSHSQEIREWKSQVWFIHAKDKPGVAPLAMPTSWPWRTCGATTGTVVTQGFLHGWWSGGIKDQELHIIHGVNGLHLDRWENILAKFLRQSVLLINTLYLVMSITNIFKALWNK